MAANVGKNQIKISSNTTKNLKKYYTQIQRINNQTFIFKIMKKKIGQLIKEHVESKNLEVTKFANLIGKDRSTAYDIFLRDSIDTNLLEKIGQVLDYDFFQEFISDKTKKEIILRNSFTSKVYVELDLTDEEIIKLGIADKVIKQII